MIGQAQKANKVKEMDSNSSLILLGGIGPAKTEFYDELNSELVKKCRFVEITLLVNNTNDKVSNMASVPLCQALFFFYKKKKLP